MKRKTSMIERGLLLAAVAILGASAANAASIYVNDDWGVTPTRSNATIPYEGQAEDRIYYNPYTNAYSATPFTNEVGAISGPHSVETGLKAQEYFPLGSTYLGLTNGDTVADFTDPITGSTVSGALYGTTAFSTIKDAIAAIGSNAAPGGTDTIVILSGTYYESLIFPRNNTTTGTGVTTNYYSPLTHADFNGKMAAGFTITGDPVNKPLVTRGAFFDNEATTDFTLSNIHFVGTPAYPAGNITPAYSGRHLVLFFNGQTTTLPDPTTGAGYRKNITLKNNVIDAQGVKLPFGSKVPLFTAQFPAYTTLPANNHIAGVSGGRGGLVLKGEYGNITVEGNTFTGTRNFITFDTNRETNGDVTWSNAYIRHNTIIDTWGNFGLRGEDPGASGRQPTAGISDIAIIENNTVRNMGEGILIPYKLDGGALRVAAANEAPFDYVHDSAPNSGAAFKLFNLRNPTFRNNSIYRVNIMQDWFTKPAADKVPVGHPNFIPMGAGVLVRDIRRSDIAPTAWAPGEYTNAQILGNLFDSCQQGIGIDPPGAQKYIPGGLVSGNVFNKNRSAFYFYDAFVNSVAWEISGNIITNASDDPMDTGITSGDNVNQDLVGGIVFGSDAGVAPEGTAPTLNVGDNFWGDVAGPGGDGILIAAPQPLAVIRVENLTPIRVTVGSPTEGATVASAQRNHNLIQGQTVTITGGPASAPYTSINGTFQIGYVAATTVTLIGTTAAGTAGTASVPIAVVDRPSFVKDAATVPSPAALDGADQFETAYPNLDTDGDGINDVVEDAIGTDKNVADSDGDGIPDGIELRIGSDPMDEDSPTVGGANTDTDKDGIPDSVEILLGLNQNAADTDGDGIRDDWELRAGSDATDANSFPNFGDADNSGGKGDFDDAVAVLRAVLNISALNATNRDNVDVNRDGKVGLVDAIVIYNFDAGNISYIPFP